MVLHPSKQRAYIYENFTLKHHSNLHTEVHITSNTVLCLIADHNVVSEAETAHPAYRLNTGRNTCCYMNHCCVVLIRD